MRLTRSIVLLAVLLLPLLSWTAGLGGLPLCCLGMSCPLAVSAPAMPQCAMQARASGCHWTPAPQLPLTLPPPLLPPAVFAASDRLAAQTATLAGPSRAAAPGWPPGVFHPPQS